MRIAHTLGLVTSLLVLAACSGGGGTTSSGGGPAAPSRTEDQYCAARESRLKACASDAAPASPFDRVSCGKEYRCHVKVNADPNAYLDCRTSSDCAATTGDDKCMAEAGRGRSTVEADKCAKKHAECKAAGKSFSDDNCGIMPALEPSTLASLAACIDKPCDQIKDCLDATEKAIPECN